MALVEPHADTAFSSQPVAATSVSGWRLATRNLAIERLDRGCPLLHLSLEVPCALVRSSSPHLPTLLVGLGSDLKALQSGLAFAA